MQPFVWGHHIPDKWGSHSFCIGGYSIEPWDAVADVLYLHVGYSFLPKTESRMYLDLYNYKKQPLGFFVINR